MDFKEGIHKSLPVDELPETQSGSQQQKQSRPTRVIQIAVGVVLLICLVGGSVIGFRVWQAARPHPSAVAKPQPHGWCVVPGPATIKPNASDPQNHPEWIPTLYGVAAISTKDAWAVGSYQNKGLIEHWDGTRWSVVAAPAVSNGSYGLTGISAISAHDIWVVGSVTSGHYTWGSQDLLGLHTLIEHWDGQHWNIIPSPDGVKISFEAGGGLSGTNQLNSVAAISANNVWAAGVELSTDNQSNALVEHWDGSHWNVVHLPASIEESNIQAITALSTGDVWMVGSSSRATGSSPLIVHWDGTQWASVVNPHAGNSSGTLRAISASSANDIWVAGDLVSTANGPSASSPFIEHWDGTQWSVVSTAKVKAPVGSENSYSIQFLSLAAISPDNAWAIGSDSQFEDIIIEHWNGQQWMQVHQAHPPFGNVNALAEAGGKIWAVGLSEINDNDSGFLPHDELIETIC